MSEHQQQLTEEQGAVNEEQLVPVGEAIKYRKRAQVAEQRVEALSQQLAESEQKLGETQGRLATVGLEGELTRQLVVAGAVDLEVALLLAKEQCGSSDETGPDIGAVVEQLRQKRPGLFGTSNDSFAPATAGRRRANQGSGARLEQMAQQANQTQSRKDMQEYLRLRRSVRGAG